MEAISNVRNRIVSRLETTTIVKGKANLDRGKEMLQLLRQGEVEILHKLVAIDEEQHSRNLEISYKAADEHREKWTGTDWENPPDEKLKAVIRLQRSWHKYCFFNKGPLAELRALHTAKAKAKKMGLSRVTRKAAMDLLDQQETQTKTHELVNFLSRDAFEAFQEKSEAQQQTALTAKSLRLAPGNPDDDTFLVSEYGIFLVRAIADVVNVAGECGVSWEDIKIFEDEVVNFTVSYKRSFCAIFVYTQTFYQDRLGTNIGKAQKKGRFSSGHHAQRVL